MKKNATSSTDNLPCWLGRRFTLSIYTSTTWSGILCTPKHTFSMPSARKNINISEDIPKGRPIVRKLVQTIQTHTSQRLALGKHATRHRPVGKHKYPIRKHIITMPSVRKRIKVFTHIRKGSSQEAVCTYENIM